jgi:hypothetical protein
MKEPKPKSCFEQHIFFYICNYKSVSDSTNEIKSISNLANQPHGGCAGKGTVLHPHFKPSRALTSFPTQCIL